MRLMLKHMLNWMQHMWRTFHALPMKATPKHIQLAKYILFSACYDAIVYGCYILFSIELLLHFDWDRCIPGWPRGPSERSSLTFCMIMYVVLTQTFNGYFYKIQIEFHCDKIIGISFNICAAIYNKFGVFVGILEDWFIYIYIYMLISM